MEKELKHRPRWQRWLALAHALGLLMIAAGGVLYWQGADQQRQQLLLLAILWGLGGILVSPWPVVKAILWMQQQPTRSTPPAGCRPDQQNENAGPPES